jgi:hypothetical protein
MGNEIKKRETFEKLIEITSELPAGDVRDILIFSQGVKAASQTRCHDEEKEGEAS